MAASATADSGIEYNVFVFAKGSKQAQSAHTGNDMQGAMDMAEKLAASGKYAQVEVKQKYFDKKANRVVDVPLKSLKVKQKNPAVAIVGMIFLALLAGGGAFAAAYFLTR